MKRNLLFRVTLSAALAAGVLMAAEVWSKDPKEWSATDVQRILTSSPWAAKVAVQQERGSYDSNYPSSGQTGQGGQGGGMGRSGGMGYPGSGSGWPGASGGGMGGGMGGMGGGMGRGRRGGQQSQERSDVVVRWDSAVPVQEALKKSEFGSTTPDAGDATKDDASKEAGSPKESAASPKEEAEKFYVISVSGLRTPSSSRYNDDDSSSSRSSSSDHMRNVLLSSTQLLVKNKEALSPDNVKIADENDGTETARFLFPRSKPIDLDDKEVTFITQTGHMKIERKFKLKEMMYNGKLSL